MARRRLAVIAIFLLAAAAAGSFAALDLTSDDVVSSSALGKEFVALPLPLERTRELFDIGVADINGDDHLDIFSANHNTRQILWVADGKGGFVDKLSAMGLDQDPLFPGSEIADGEPKLREPGVYVYWEGRNAESQFPLVIRTHRLQEVGKLQGRLQTYSAIHGFDAGVFSVQPPTSETVAGSEKPLTSLRFEVERDGVLKVQVGSPGVPVSLRISDSMPLANVFVGQQKVTPSASEFEMRFQDRHGMAWSDYNGDGLLDVFVSRGAIGGTLRMFSPSFRAKVQDELLLSRADSRYDNATASSGIEKRGCSGRKVTWVDFDRDGRLDLLINCMERGFVGGDYPKQFYRQSGDGKFVEVAADVGLALADREIIDLAWIDVDGDGYPDVVTHEADGFFLYRNLAGATFSRHFVGRGKFVRAERPQLKGTSDEYWFVDGKLAVADVDGDGHLDVFVASKMGNSLLLNDGRGSFSLVDPASKGLPDKSATAVWVDYDNDGLVDLFSVPHGLSRQRGDRSFEATGLLALPERKYMAAIANWADFDNSGSRDLVMVVLENFSFWNWWERLRRTAADRFTWKLSGYRNLGNSNHWLQLRLVGKRGNLQAIGAVVTARTPGGEQTQVVGLNDGAFFSQGHYRLYFGLGPHGRVDTLRVRWPDGQVQELRDVEADGLRVISQTDADKQAALR